MFVVRIGKVDHYMAPPVRGMDVCYSEFRSRQLTRVPVLRIFGSTPLGQKACVHVHGIFPYILIPYDGTQPLDRYTHQLAVALELALVGSQNPTDSSLQNVYKVELVSGTPFYGFHAKEHQFLKVSFLDSDVVPRAIDLLLNGAVMNRPFQPHEAHIPFILQMFIDYNLCGMNLVRFGNVKFRHSLGATIADTQSDTPTSTRSSASSSAAFSSQQYWNLDALPSSLLMDKSVPRVSSCELELDAMSSEILNVKELAGANMNPGIQAILEDEKIRRRQMNESSQLSAPSSQDRPSFEPKGSELLFLEQLRAKLESANLSQASQLGMDDSQVHDNSGVESNPLDPGVASSLRPNLMSPPPQSQRLSQQSFSADDQEILNLILDLVEDDSNKTIVGSSPRDTLPGRPDVVAMAAVDSSEDEGGDGVDAEDELTMSQIIWDTDPGLGTTPSAGSQSCRSEASDDSLDWGDDIPQVDGPTDPPDRSTVPKKPEARPPSETHSRMVDSPPRENYLQRLGLLSSALPSVTCAPPEAGSKRKSSLDEFGFTNISQSVQKLIDGQAEVGTKPAISDRTPEVPLPGVASEQQVATRMTPNIEIGSCDASLNSLATGNVIFNRPVLMAGAARSRPAQVLPMSALLNTQSRQQSMQGIRRIAAPSQICQTGAGASTAASDFSRREVAPALANNPAAVAPAKIIGRIVGRCQAPISTFNASFEQFLFSKLQNKPRLSLTPARTIPSTSEDRVRQTGSIRLSSPSSSTRRLSLSPATKSSAEKSSDAPSYTRAMYCATSAIIRDIDLSNEDGVIGSVSLDSKAPNTPSQPFTNLMQASPSVVHRKFQLDGRVDKSSHAASSSTPIQWQRRPSGAAGVTCERNGGSLALQMSARMRPAHSLSGKTAAAAANNQNVLRAMGVCSDTPGPSGLSSRGPAHGARSSRTVFNPVNKRHLHEADPGSDLTLSSGKDYRSDSSLGSRHIQTSFRTPHRVSVDGRSVAAQPVVRPSTASPRVCVRGVSVGIQLGASHAAIKQLGRELLVLRRLESPRGPLLAEGSSAISLPSAGRNDKTLVTPSSYPTARESVPKVRIVKRESNDWSVKNNISICLSSSGKAIIDQSVSVLTDSDSADVPKTTSEAVDLQVTVPCATNQSTTSLDATDQREDAFDSANQPETTPNSIVTDLSSNCQPDASASSDVNAAPVGSTFNSDERSQNSEQVPLQLTAMPLVKLTPLDESRLSSYAVSCDKMVGSNRRSSLNSSLRRRSAGESILKYDISTSGSESDSPMTDTSSSCPKRTGKSGQRDLLASRSKAAKTRSLRQALTCSDSLSSDCGPPHRKAGPKSRRRASCMEVASDGSSDQKYWRSLKRNWSVHKGVTEDSTKTGTADVDNVNSLVEGQRAVGEIERARAADTSESESFAVEQESAEASSIVLSDAPQSSSQDGPESSSKGCSQLPGTHTSNRGGGCSRQAGAGGRGRLAGSLGRGRGRPAGSLGCGRPLGSLSSGRPSGSLGRGRLAGSLYQGRGQRPGPLSTVGRRHPRPRSKKSGSPSVPLNRYWGRLRKFLNIGRGRSIPHGGGGEPKISASPPLEMDVVEASASAAPKSRALQPISPRRSTHPFQASQFKRRVMTEQSRKANTLLQRAKGQKKKKVNFVASQHRVPVSLGVKYAGQKSQKMVYQFGGRKAIAAEAIMSSSGLRTLYKIDPADDIRIIPWPSNKGFVITQLIKNTQLRYTVRGADKHSKPPPNQIWVQDQNGRYSIVVERHVRRMHIDTLNPYVRLDRLDRRTIFEHSGEMPPIYPKSLRMENHMTKSLSMMKTRKGNTNKENKPAPLDRKLDKKRVFCKRRKNRWGSDASSDEAKCAGTASEEEEEELGDDNSDTQVYHHNRWRDLYPVNHRRAVPSPSAELQSRIMTAFLAKAEADAEAADLGVLTSDDDSIDRDYVSVDSDWEYGGGVVQNLTRLKQGVTRKGYDPSCRRKISFNNVPQYVPAPPTYHRTASPRTCNWYSPQREQPEADNELVGGAVQAEEWIGSHEHEFLSPLLVAVPSPLDAHCNGSNSNCVCPVKTADAVGPMPLSSDVDYWQLTSHLESLDDRLGAGKDVMFQFAFMSPRRTSIDDDCSSPPVCASPTEDSPFRPFSHRHDGDDDHAGGKNEFKTDAPRLSSGRNWADVCAWNRMNLTDDCSVDSEDLSASMSIPISESFSEATELPCSSLPISFVEGMTDDFLNEPPLLKPCDSGYPELDPAALAFCPEFPAVNIGASISDSGTAVLSDQFPVGPEYLADTESFNPDQVLATRSDWSDVTSRTLTQGQEGSGQGKGEFDFSLFEADEVENDVANAWNGLFVDPSSLGGENDCGDAEMADCDLEKLKNDLDAAAFLGDDPMETSVYHSDGGLIHASSSAAVMEFDSPSVAAAAGSSVASYDTSGFVNSTSAQDTVHGEALTGFATACHPLNIVDNNFVSMTDSPGDQLMDACGSFAGSVAAVAAPPNSFCNPPSSSPQPNHSSPTVSQSGENSPEMFTDCWDDDLKTFEKFQRDTLLPFPSSFSGFNDANGGAAKTAGLSQAAATQDTGLEIWEAGQMNPRCGKILEEAVGKFGSLRSVLLPISLASISARRDSFSEGTTEVDNSLSHPTASDAIHRVDSEDRSDTPVVSQEARSVGQSSTDDGNRRISKEITDWDDVIPPTPELDYCIATFGSGAGSVLGVMSESSNVSDSSGLSSTPAPESGAASPNDFLGFGGDASPNDFLGFGDDVVQTSRLKLQNSRKLKRIRARTKKLTALVPDHSPSKDKTFPSVPIDFSPPGVAGVVTKVAEAFYLPDHCTPVRTPNSTLRGKLPGNSHLDTHRTGGDDSKADDSPIRSFYQFRSSQTATNFPSSDTQSYVCLDDSETNASTPISNRTTSTATAAITEEHAAGSSLRRPDAILLEYPIRPPSPRRIRATLAEHGLTEVRHPEPYCSDPRDVPTRAVPLGGVATGLRLRHGTEVLLPLESKLANTGLENWKLLLSFGQADGDFVCPPYCPTIGGVEGHAPVPPTLYRGVCCVSTTRPPSCADVESWMASRQLKLQASKAGDAPRSSDEPKPQPQKGASNRDSKCCHQRPKVSAEIEKSPAWQGLPGAVLSVIAEDREATFLTANCSPIGFSQPQEPPATTEDATGFGNVRHSTPAVGSDAGYRGRTFKRKRSAVALDFGRSDLASSSFGSVALSDLDTDRKDVFGNLRDISTSPEAKRAHGDCSSRLPELPSYIPEVDDELSQSQSEHNYARSPNTTEVAACASEPTTPSCSPTLPLLLPSPRCPTQERSSDVGVPLRKILFSRKVKDDLTRLNNVSTSQLDGPTPKNAFGFKLSAESLQAETFSHLYQYVTMMSLELHVETVGTLRPDPATNPIRAIFYHVLRDIPHDGPPQKCGKRVVTGIVIAPNFTTPAGVPAQSAFTDVAKPSTSDATASTSAQKPFHDGVESATSKKTSFVLPSTYARSLLADDVIVANVATELNLIQEFVKIMTSHDPDILVGHEVQMSSWGFLVERAQKLGIKLCHSLSRVPGDAGNSFKNPQEANGNEEYFLKIVGRDILNLSRVLRHELALYNYSFENLAYHVLHRRIPLHSFESLTAWFNNPASCWRTLQHYLIRVGGNVAILEQLNFVGRTSELARLFGIQFHEVIDRGTQFRVESMMLRLAKLQNYVAVSPSPQQRSSMRAPEHLALILEPHSRYFANPVVVLDFQSLYPSMMIAYNYCFSTCLGRVDSIGNPEAFQFGCTSLKVPLGLIKKLRNKFTVAPCGTAFVKPEVRKGILPQMLEDILAVRIMVKLAMKKHKGDKALTRMLDARQLGLKLIANVTYGYTSASFSGRMPCIEIADSVVSKGRETLERAIATIKATERWGGKVIYGDTDSVFVLLEGRSMEQAFAIGQEIADVVTADNPKPVKLKLEKVYMPCVLETKKRYVGFMYESPDQVEPTYDAKGIETVRRDGCPAVAKILEKLLRTLFRTHDVSQVKRYVQRQFEKIITGRSGLADFIFTRKYRGRKGYRVDSAPALRIARRLIRSDARAEPRVGERVPYVVIYGSPGTQLMELVRHPLELLRNSDLRLNATYYITRAIIPALNRIVTLLGDDVNNWYTTLARSVRAPLPYKRQTGDGGTIARYFVTTNCPVCDTLASSAGICGQCRSDPQSTTLVLTNKIRNWEKRFSDIAKVCQGCSNSADNSFDCISIDCPILFRRFQSNRDLLQAPYLHRLLKDLSLDW